MKEKWKQMIKLSVCGLLLSLTVILLLPGIQSEAAAKKPTCVKKQTVYLTKSDVGREVLGKPYYVGYDISSYIFIKNLSSNAKITNIKSSNKKISVSNMLKEPTFPSKSLYLYGKNCKPGETSRITFKVKQGGKTYNLSCKITLKMKASNFKTFSIGGKNYASKLSGYSGTAMVAELKIRPLKGTFRIKMKSGIKLESVRLVRFNKGKTVTKSLKNGSKVSLKKGDQIQISYKYTKKPVNYNFTYKGPNYSIPGLHLLKLGGTTVINVV